MKRPNAPQRDLTELDARTALLLANSTCVYCGTILSPENHTKEHVIGRRFVPKGTLDKHWNLIVNACARCNRIKSDLEDDLSAVTLHADAFGRSPSDDPRVIGDARRKAAGSVSRRTNKLIKDSRETFSVTAPMSAGLTLSARFTAPPQPDGERAFRLARMHLCAFFYLVTYNATRRCGYWWPGDYMMLNAAPRTDWGNVWQQGFAKAVIAWEPRLLLHISPDSFFSAVLRKHPTDACWSWALEWNRNYRLLGFLGDSKVASALVEGFQPPQSHLVYRDEKRTVVFRREITLEEADDLLFVYDGPVARPGVAT